MKKCLILQSWHSKPEDDWYPWLKEKLEKKGYQVEIPDLPTIRTNLPSLKKMLNAVNKLKIVDQDTVVIGHSIGTLVAMRLAEKTKFKSMILLAGWDFDDLTKEHRLFWPNRINHQKIIKNTKKIFLSILRQRPLHHCFSSKRDD